MATVDAGGPLAQQIQNAIQPKLMENGWVTEETDTTLSEYVTMMIVNGKDMQGVQSELGGDLLGVGEDDPGVGEFAQWLFGHVNALSGASQQQAPQDQPQPIPTIQDAAMEEDAPAAADAPPTGPKSMRNGPQRGRGGRMLGQMNRNMDRSSDLPDNLRRIKGAAGVQTGRINSHAGRDAPPRGPKHSNIANGVQRMMNGGRGGHQNMQPGVNNNNPMMQNMGNMNQSQQMQFMQMMEMQANLLTQMMNQQQGGPGQFAIGQHGGRGGRGGRGAHRGGRGDHHQEPRLKAVNGKMPDGALPTGGGGGDGMDVDTEEKGDKFATQCRFDLSCTNAACGFAHHGPATHAIGSIDFTSTCTFGAACTNNKCIGRHPSPAQKQQHLKQAVDCKFYPNCNNPKCPFRHPNTPPCRNGADCTTSDCPFGHSKIMCRYNPCLNPNCTFQHGDGQKRGKFEDKVWTAGETKSERFAGFSLTEDGEELILPKQETNGTNGATDASAAGLKTEMNADVVT